MKFFRSRLFRIYISTVFIALLGSAPLYSWDAAGHKISAYIAWQQMKPEVRDEVFRILMRAPENSDLSKPYDRFNSRSEARKRLDLFMYASIWPDVVKNRLFDVRNKKYNQGNWHYGAIFWRQENGKAVELKDFEGAGGLAVEKLVDFERIMRDKSFSDEERALAIAWFLHVGGDLHNPLHNASRVTDTEPEGDQGGNLFVLVPRTETSFGVNLHSYWDGIFSRVHPRKNDASDPEYLIPLGRKFIKKHRFKRLSDRLNLGRYQEWNRAGYGFLNDIVYSGVERGQLPGKRYRKRAYKTAREQITLAGYRIGETFNRVFASESGMLVSECRIIRRVLYPVSKRPMPGRKLRIALLNVCPPNRGKVARPTVATKSGANLEFDIVRLFDTEEEAKRFAQSNGISDVEFGN